MGICVYFIGHINLPNIIVLIIQVIVGATIYIVMSIVFKLESFLYLWNMVKTYLKK